MCVVWSGGLVGVGGSPEQGPLTIVRRSSGRKGAGGSKEGSTPQEEVCLETLDLETDHLPPFDTPDACDKAALRLRGLLQQLQRGEISAEILQKNLLYAAKVLEAVFIDETKAKDAAQDEDESEKTKPDDKDSQDTPSTPRRSHNQRRLRAPVWASSKPARS
ncbi:hypothetical protein GE061_009673 [Apolygus lucorum]|uniref:Uncharacterized protein n=1 Tax=Apolygus lucorum TaxID=248454 RepID=A0A8S9Y2X1_APOLU|nr:hypothetical protein GE061_009673 [Apolygus lucorum]